VCVCVYIYMCVCVCVCVLKMLRCVELVVDVECRLTRRCHSFYMLYDVGVCRVLLINHMC
jgi:hypothetical protein